MARHADMPAEQVRLDRLYREIYHLPKRMRCTRAKLARLEERARFLGMDELLSDPRHADAAFEREVAAAKKASKE